MMSEGDLFKYDVRVRERMLRKGLVSEDGVKAHLDGLPDRGSDCETSTTTQPALGRSEEALRIERAARALEMQAAPPTPPMVRAPAPLAPAPVGLDEDEDEDDDEDEDEDDEDEDEDDLDEPEAELAGQAQAEPDEPETPAEDKEPESAGETGSGATEDVDDDWGAES